MTSTDPTAGLSAWTPALIDPDQTSASIQASDATGLHTLDSAAVLTGLTLTDDVLSWQHDGTQRTVALTP